MSKFTSQNPTGVAESPAMPTTRPLTPSKSNGRTHSSAEASFLISPQVLNGNISRAVVDHACTPVRSVNSAPVSGRSTFAAPPNLPFQPENGQCSPDVSSQFIGTSAGFDTFTGSSTLMATEPEKSNDWDVSYPIDYPWPGIENQSIFDEESLSLEDLFNLQEGWQQAMAAEATAFGNKTASEQPSTTRTKPDLVTIEGIPGAGSPNPSRASPHFSFGFGGGGGGGGGGYSPSSVGRRTYESFSSTTAHHQSSIYDSRCSASAYHRVFNDNNIYTRTNARSSRAISGYLSHQNESEEETSSSCCDEDEYGQERRAQHSGHKYQLSIRLKRGEE
jgi:hypothetical protein